MYLYGVAYIMIRGKIAMEQKSEIKKLENEKKRAVQKLAMYYRLVQELDQGAHREKIAQEILSFKQEIFQINQKLAVLKK